MRKCAAAVDYEFVSIHELLGVARGPGAIRIELTPPESSTQVLITDDIEADIAQLERRLAVGNTMLRRLVGQGRDVPREDAVTAETLRLADERRRARTNAVYLVYRTTGAAASFDAQAESDWGDFDVMINGPSSSEIKQEHAPHVAGFLTALALSHELLWSSRTVAEGTIFLRDGRPVYSFSPTGQGVAYVSSPISADTIAFVKSRASAIRARETLSQTAQLLARSMDDSIDDLLSFLSAWAALELFVKRSYDELDQNPRGLEHRFKRVAREFTSASDYDVDLATFKRLYFLRNNLYHEGALPTAYPTHDASALLRKYLVLYAATVVDALTDDPGSPAL